MRTVESLKKRAFNVVFFGLVQRLPLKIANRIVSRFYDLLNWQLGDASSEFTNYGYAMVEGQEPGTMAASEEQKYDYLSRQLYHKLAGSIDLRGKDVLEVGCGRGGGAAYIKEQLGPKSLAGIDLSQKAIEFCAPAISARTTDFQTGCRRKHPVSGQRLRRRDQCGVVPHLPVDDQVSV